MIITQIAHAAAPMDPAFYPQYRSSDSAFLITSGLTVLVFLGIILVTWLMQAQKKLSKKQVIASVIYAIWIGVATVLSFTNAVGCIDCRFRTGPAHYILNGYTALISLVSAGLITWFYPLKHKKKATRVFRKVLIFVFFMIVAGIVSELLFEIVGKNFNTFSYGV